MSQLEELQDQITNAQTLHKMHMEKGEINAASEVVGTIDQLQRQYDFLKSNGGGKAEMRAPEKSQSRRYSFQDRPSPNVLPDIDGQIQHVQTLLKTNFGVGSIMLEGIFQSLVELKLIKASQQETDLIVSLPPTNEVIQKMPERYDLEAQFEFLEGLIAVTEENDTDEVGKRLVKMYRGMHDSLQTSHFVAKVTADYLLRQPDNQPGQELFPKEVSHG